MKNKSLIVLLFLALTLVSCGGKNSSPSTTTSSTTTTTSSSTSTSSVINANDIEINVNVLKIIKGKKGILIAKALPENAVDKELEFSVPIGDDIISIDENGIVTAIDTGYAEIVVSLKENPEISKTVYVNVIGQNYNVDYICPYASNDVTYYNFNTELYSPAKGKQKILIIPVRFPDIEENATPANIELIAKAYGGTKEECGWLSFKEYYKNASFGALDYECYMADEWFTLPDKYTSKWAETNMFYEVVPLALEWFKNNYSDIDLSIFDNDHNNLVDNIHLIYNTDYRNGTNLWTYASIAQHDENPTTIQAANYALIPLGLFTNTRMYGGVPENGINTKTIIHENGHNLGLIDYYDTSRTGTYPLGNADMQENHTFDWNAFSKYAVGWIQPRYVDEQRLKDAGSVTIQLSSSSLDGDCLILKNSTWTGTTFDEYILIELFNPDAPNNYYDSHYSVYDNHREIGYGVKIYHVNAKTWQAGSEAVEVVYKDNYLETKNRNTLYNNGGVSRRNPDSFPFTIVDPENINCLFLQLIQKGGENTFVIGNEHSGINNSDLWQTDDTFTIGNHEGYKDYGANYFTKQTMFDDGTPFPYGIRFDEVMPNNATITITYLGD